MPSEARHSSLYTVYTRMQQEVSCARRKLVAYCVLHAVEGAMEGKRCKGAIGASEDETAAKEAAGASGAVSKSLESLGAQGPSVLDSISRLATLPTKAIATTVLCFQHALRLAEMLFGSAPKFSPQMIVCILGDTRRTRASCT